MSALHWSEGLFGCHKINTNPIYSLLMCRAGFTNTEELKWKKHVQCPGSALKLYFHIVFWNPIDYVLPPWLNEAGSRKWFHLWVRHLSACSSPFARLLLSDGGNSIHSFCLWITCFSPFLSVLVLFVWFCVDAKFWFCSSLTILIDLSLLRA